MGLFSEPWGFLKAHLQFVHMHGSLCAPSTWWGWVGQTHEQETRAAEMRPSNWDRYEHRVGGAIRPGTQCEQRCRGETGKGPEQGACTLTGGAAGLADLGSAFPVQSVVEEAPFHASS